MEYYKNYLKHHGIKGQKWGIRRYQNEDGTLTEEGHKRLKEIATLVGKTKSVEIDSERARKNNSTLLMPSDELEQYKKDKIRLNKLLIKYGKEGIYFDTATRKSKTGEEFIATIYSNGKSINDIPVSSIYEYKLDLINKE